MKRLIAGIALLAIPALAGESDQSSVIFGTGLTEYCEARGDPYCLDDQARGLAIYKDFLAWWHVQRAKSGRAGIAAQDALVHCDNRYAPNALAFAACLDGFMFDRR